MELRRRSPLGALPPGRNAGVWAGVADLVFFFFFFGWGGCGGFVLHGLVGAMILQTSTSLSITTGALSVTVTAC